MNPMILSDKEFNSLPDVPEAKPSMILSDDEFNNLPDYTPPKKEKMGVAEAGLTGLGEGASLGFGDELAGLVGAAIDRPVSYLIDKYKGVPEDLRGEPETSTFGERYRQTRDIARRQQAQAKEDQPVAYYGGMVGGGLATGIATGGVGPAGLTGRAALEGGLAGLGTSEAELTTGEPMQYGQAALETGLGAGLGVAASKAIPAVTKFAGEKINAVKTRAKNFLNNLEKDAAMDLLEVTPLVRTKLANKGVTLNKTQATNVAEELPGFLKEQGMSIRSTGALKNAVDEVKNEAGKKIDNIITKADDEISRTVANEANPEIYDKYKFNFNNLANAIDEEFVAPIRNVPGFESQVAKIENYLTALRAKQETLSIRELHNLRKYTDQLIKDFSKSPEKMTQYDETLRFVRKELSDHIKDKIVPLYDNVALKNTKDPMAYLRKSSEMLKDIPTGGEINYPTAKELYQANRNYKMASEVSDMLDKAEARQDARRLISLTDFILGTGAYAVTDPLGGALSVAGKKALEYAKPRAQLYSSEIARGITKPFVKGAEKISKIPQGGLRTPTIMSAVQGTKYANVFNEKDPQKNAVKHKLLMERDPEYRKLFNENKLNEE